MSRESVAEETKTAMGISLECSSVEKSAKTLKLSARLTNSSSTDIYVFNRLWDLGANNVPEPDPHKVYRFIHGSELRLLLGAAPLPRLKTTTYRNIPYATLVKSHHSLNIDESLSLPVEEHSVYFAKDSSSSAKPVKVNRVVLLVQFVLARSGYECTPGPFDREAVKLEVPGILDHAQTAQCRFNPVEIEALRRTDQFDRLILPGETPEPLVLPQ